ncbi:MAG TPA: ABC transporter ATP-binding protein [Anaerolineaceae bacterium]|nr:ABC transporter ATP-binding protein [Anaerolineaceae bacterium]
MSLAFNWFAPTPKPGPAAAYGSGSQALIRLKELKKSYHSAAGDTTVLRGLDLEVHSGEFVGIVGKSGSGKTTLLNMITGIDRPSSGEIWVGDTAVHQLSEGQMAVWRGKNLGIVFQFFQLLPMLTLLDNVMLPMDFCRLYTPAQRKDRAMELLDLVGMADQAYKLPPAISGGQQQRVAIARALANDPPLIIADEPTGNLDSRTAEAVFDLFETLAGQGKTFLIVTHDVTLSARLHRTARIADGEIVSDEVLAVLPPALARVEHIQ